MRARDGHGSITNGHGIIERFHYQARDPFGNDLGGLDESFKSGSASDNFKDLFIDDVDMQSGAGGNRTSYKLYG